MGAWVVMGCDDQRPDLATLSIHEADLMAIQTDFYGPGLHGHRIRLPARARRRRICGLLLGVAVVDSRERGLGQSGREVRLDHLVEPSVVLSDGLPDLDHLHAAVFDP